MSLLSYASPWTNDNHSVNKQDAGAPSRKRAPTMSNARKTIKVRPNSSSAQDEYDIYKQEEVPDDAHVSVRSQSKPDTIEDVLTKQTETNTKINSILNKITSFSNDERLGDFNPMPYPTSLNKKNADQLVPGEPSPSPLGENPLLPKTGSPEFTRGGAPSNGVYFRPSETNEKSNTYANYRDAYGKEGMSIGGSGGSKEPYYSKMGIGKTGDKVMDRLNYMTQMLESLQMEKTNHITEEFILYTLLGVFMIYIVDGFSRGGKYVR